jgi:acid stress-induced BolA-like protein IbaG/YrbA
MQKARQCMPNATFCKLWQIAYLTAPVVIPWEYQRLCDRIARCFQRFRTVFMTMSTSEISALLTAAFPDAGVQVGGGEGKYQVLLISTAFAGLNRVKRQQAVYKVLNAHIQSGAIHAVNMQLQTPEESAASA